MVEQALTNMVGGKRMGFCSLGLRSILHTVHGWVKCIAEQKMPDIRGDATDEFLKGCLDRLGFLTSREALGDSKTAKSVEYGHRAAELYFEDMAAKVTLASTPSFNECMQLNTFSWLLTESQRKTLTKWEGAAVSAAKRRVEDDDATEKKLGWKNKLRRCVSHCRGHLQLR